MTIGIIGPGRLGICFALLLEKSGHSVIVSDIKKSYVDSINNKIIESNEPHVNELLNSSTKLKAVYKNSQVIDQCNLIFAIVSTPSLPSGRYDVSSLEDIVQEFSSRKDVKGKTLIITSTTNPGDCEKFQAHLNAAGVSVLYNPEFIAQGSIITDIQTADMVLIGGTDQKSINSVISLYAELQSRDPNMHCMSLTAAEVVKIAVNCYLTTKISYANIVGQVLISAGLDNEVDLVLLAIGNDTRIGTKYLNFGHGFGGPCLPRDNRSFGNYATSLGIDFNLGTQIDEFNKSHLNFLKQYYINKNTSNIPFYFKYVSYKESTDIFEESQQLALCRELLKDGFLVCIEDSYLINSYLKDELVIAGAKFVNKQSTDIKLLTVDL
jgi:nucleotide sugar dehydrogenase